MTLAYVALGSNLGDRQARLDAAASELDALSGVRVLRRSPWIETDPVGGPAGQGRYLNGVVELDCDLAPRELLQRMMEIEARHGRVRTVRDGPRTLDLDLLLFGDERLESAELTLPHPRMEEREFVLAPLERLAPQLVLGRSGRTVREQLAALREPCKRASAGHAPPPMTRTFEAPDAAIEWLASRRSGGRSVGFVPTMGALHAGHLELVRRARAENDLVCVSVFVNPLQFDDRRDFERYPRDFAADAELLATERCDLVFSGTLAQFFPGSDGRADRVPITAAGRASLGLEGAHRPGHFDGVATIVERLFELVRPTRAYFGAKDFQQTLVVGELAQRMGYPRIVVCPTSREPSGLARSSRNALLAPRDLERAPAIHAALVAAREAWRQRGVRRAAELSSVMRTALAPSGLEVEYAEVRDPLDWTEHAPDVALERAIALIAARAGAVRLIDNLRLDRDEEAAP